jgi:hypothetical protein
VTLPVSRLTGASNPSGRSASGRIDCQSHLFAPELLDFMEKRKTTPYVYRKGNDRFVVVGEWHRRILPKHTDVAAKLADMDANGIQMTALSINDPGRELFGKDGLAIAQWFTTIWVESSNNIRAFLRPGDPAVARHGCCTPRVDVRDQAPGCAGFCYIQPGRKVSRP